MTVSLPPNEEKLYKLLKVIRKRPGMFIHPLNIYNLGHFIAGYDSFSFFDDNYIDVLAIHEPSFYDWIAIKEGKKLSPRQGWMDILNARSDLSEEGKVDLFFRYLDDYTETIVYPSLTADT